MANTAPSTGDEPLSTLDAARLMGLAVRSVQLMVDRGELQAWKTPGGHRRISRASVQQWLQAQKPQPEGAPTAVAGAGRQAAAPGRRVLLIEDSAHFQNLVSLLIGQRFPEVQLKVASDGIAGLAMIGEWQPEVVLVDILLPGIDGGTLITSLRTQPQFRHSRLIVVTSLDEEQRAPYAYALQGVPVVHKPRLVADLPPLLAATLAGRHLPLAR